MFCLGGILAFFDLDKRREDPIENTIKRGILALQRKDYKKAEQFLHLALKMSQDELNLKAITYCYDIMANIAYEAGDYRKAEKLFVETMKRIITEGSPADDNAIVEMSLKIATMCGRQGAHSKAEQGFMFCIDTQRRKIAAMSTEDAELSALARNTHLLLGLSLDHYADYQLNRGRFSEAQRLWSEALGISRKFLGPDHDQTLVLYSNLALAHEKLGQIDESVRILEDIVSRDGLAKSEDLSVFLCNLGMIYITQKKFEKAEKTFAKALEIGKKFENKAILDEIAEYLTILQTKKGEAT